MGSMKKIIRQVMHVNYWAGDHAPYQHVIRHNDGSRFSKNQLDTMHEMLNELGPGDGELINITIERTDTFPKKGQRIELISPNNYEWVEIDNG